MKTITAIVILWLLPWGALSVALMLLGSVAHGAILGALSLVGVVWLLGMVKAGRGN